MIKIISHGTCTTFWTGIQGWPWFWGWGRAWFSIANFGVHGWTCGWVPLEQVPPGFQDQVGFSWSTRPRFTLPTGSWSWVLMCVPVTGHLAESRSTMPESCPFPSSSWYNRCWSRRHARACLRIRADQIWSWARSFTPLHRMAMKNSLQRQHRIRRRSRIVKTYGC